MRIDTKNYEVYFLDYYDGMLSDEEISELFEFLRLHPDLHAEFTDYAKNKITTDKQIAYPNKELLKQNPVLARKPISFENFDEYCIAYYDGELGPLQKNELFGFLKKHPQYKRIFNMFSITILHPDTAISYPQKHELRKKVNSGFSWKIILYPVAAAAILFLLYMPISQILKNSDKNVRFASETAGIFTNKNSLSMAGSNFRKQKTIEPSYIYSSSSSEKEFYRMPENNSPDKLPTIHNNTLHQSYSFSQVKTISKLKEFTEIYYSINLKPKSGINQGTVYSIEQYANIFRNKIDNFTKSVESLKGYEIAKIGFDGINLLTDNSFDFNYKTNDDGKLTKVTINDFAVPVLIK